MYEVPTEYTELKSETAFPNREVASSIRSRLAGITTALTADRKNRDPTIADFANMSKE